MFQSSLFLSNVTMVYKRPHNLNIYLAFHLYSSDVAQETAANYVTLKIIILTSSIKRWKRVLPDTVYFLYYLFIYLFIRLIFCE